MAGALAALAIFATIVLVTQTPSTTGPVSSLSLLGGGDLWSQLVSSASARAQTEQSSLADDIRVAESSIATSEGNAAEDVVSASKSLSQQLLRAGRIASIKAATTPLATQTARARHQLGVEVAAAADAERQAINQERKAQAGIAAETALAKAFRAERRSNKVRLSNALHAMAEEAAAGVSSPLSAPSDDTAALLAPTLVSAQEPVPAAYQAAPAAYPVAAPDAVVTDQELRSDITRLQGDLDVTPSAPKGAVARAKKAAAAKQKKSQESKVEKELAAMRKELKSVKSELVQAHKAPKVQVLAVTAAPRRKTTDAARTTRAAKTPYSAKGLTSVDKDQTHCVSPLVWANGKCNSSPRGRPETKAAEARACAKGPKTPSCVTFRKNEKAKLAEYEKDLRASSDYDYTAANGGARSFSAKGKGANGRGGRSGKGGAGLSGKGARRMGGGDRDMGSLGYDLKKGLASTGDRKNPQSAAQLSKHLNDLENQIRNLDDWSNNLERNEFVMQPQRFPHADGADLGDNYVGSFGDEHGAYPAAVSDKIVPSDEAMMRQPEEFSTFFGDSKREATPMYASRHLKEKDVQRLKKNGHLLKYADRNNAWGKHSPLNKKLRRTLFGKAGRFMADRYGFPADVLPSTKQYHAQVTPPVTRSRLASQLNRRRDSVYNPNVKQRWRKGKDCVGSACTWKPVIEDKKDACEKDDCSETCMGDTCGEKVEPIEVCGPLGCEKTDPAVEADDSIEKQMSQGAIDGHADPFGAAAVFDDTEEPAEAVKLDKALRSHFRAQGGEPMGDAFLRGWDMHNGVDYQAKWDRDGKHEA